jgi:uncharacterized membrane protein
MTIRNPLEWGVDQFRLVSTTSRAGIRRDTAWQAAPPTARRISIADLKGVLTRGLSDFGACRTDVVFLCILYPLIGLVLARLAAGYDMLPLIFPLASGFALVGPLAAVGLYEMSRRREQQLPVSWASAFGVAASPSFGSIVLLGLVLAGIFVLWLVAASVIYRMTLGPQPPASIASFVHDVFMTGPGWAMIVVGIGVGFLFALVALSISVVSFPMLLDREVGFKVAVGTSIRAVILNPVPMAAWSLIVAGGLLIGSLPLFVGLAVVLPILGHSTWHLYRALVPS